jgi:hypothetical protein
MSELPRKQWRYRGVGRFVVGQLAGERFDIYRGANTFEGARKARREVSHWPNAKIFDQALDEFVS